MFDESENNPLVPSLLRWILAVECSVVFAAGVLLFFLPSLAAEVWAWRVPPFNSRFVGAVYLAAYLPLILFWFVPRWIPGRLTLWMILTFTTMIVIPMFVHWDAFAWDRLATFLVYWPLYILLPPAAAFFLARSQGLGAANEYQGSMRLRILLWIFALVSGAYGIGLLLAPEALTRFWPWEVDAFHGRMYAAAFGTPAVAAVILSFRRGFAAEYLSMGLNLCAGGFLPILGTLWTNLSVPAERQIDFSASGTWVFFLIFLISWILGLLLLAIARRLSMPASS